MKKKSTKILGRDKKAEQHILFDLNLVLVCINRENYINFISCCLVCGLKPGRY